MSSPHPAQDVIEALDSFYCHNVVAALWADAQAALPGERRAP